MHWNKRCSGRSFTEWCHL